MIFDEPVKYVLLQLFAEEAPVISGGQDAISVIPGDTAVIQCDATGAPRPQITWYKDR